MSGQYNILKFLQDSLNVKNSSDFINKLILAKGEFTYLDKIINHVTMPESLKEFHEKGKNLIKVTLTDASNGKPLNSDISKIEVPWTPDWGSISTEPPIFQRFKSIFELRELRGITNGSQHNCRIIAVRRFSLLFSSSIYFTEKQK